MRILRKEIVDVSDPKPRILDTNRDSTVLSSWLTPPESNGIYATSLVPIIDVMLYVDGEPISGCTKVNLDTKEAWIFIKEQLGDDFSQEVYDVVTGETVELRRK